VFVQRAPLRAAPLAIAVLAALLVASLPTALTSPNGPARVPAPTSGGSAVTVATAAADHAATSSSVGPIGGRLFDVDSELPSGTTNSVTGIAVDPSTGSVYAANEFAATVTVFNESTGVVEEVQPVGSFADGNYPAGDLLDTAHHRLFVSISTRFGTPGAGGWLLVLNESTLATETNISFSASPHPPFEPTFEAYDAPSDQLFVENATAGIVAIVDLATSQVTGYLECPLAGCAEHPYGLVDVPQYHTLVVPTCAKALWLVNVSNDSTRALISGPSNGALMAWTAFDDADQIMWVENYSYYGSVGTFLGYNLSTLALVAEAPGAPARESGMAYDPVANLLVTTNIDGSEAIATYNGSTGALVASSQSSTSTGHPFLALAVDPRTGVAIAGGPGNGTTIAYALPGLAIDRVYSSFPLTQVATTTDPTDGYLLITSVEPTTVQAQNEATGLTAWSATLPAAADPVGVAYDVDTGMVYVADSTSASIFAYLAPTGAYVATYPLGSTPSGLCALTVDPAKSLLYVGSTSPAEVLAFNLTLGSVVGTFLTGSYDPCRLAVDPVNHELFALATPGASELFVLASNPGGLITDRSNWSVPASSVDLAVTDEGTAYVLADSGSELVTLTQPNGAVGPSLNLSDSPASALAYDPADGLLFLAASSTAAVEVVGTAAFSLDGRLAAPNTVGPLSVDPDSGVLVAATADSGQVLIATLVPVPSSPTALSVTPGNDSLTAAWGPPVSSGADPVQGYLVVARPSTAGPATVIANESGLSGTLANLTNGVAYNLTVAAVSDAGAGVLLANTTAVPIGVPYPPTNLVVNATGTGSLAVGWSSPASDDGSSVFDYVVHYAPTDGGTALTLNAGNATAISIDGLAAQTGYAVFVTAENAAGFGHPSVTASATTAAPPPSGAWPYYLVAGAGLLVVVIVGAAVGYRSRRGRKPAMDQDAGVGSSGVEGADPSTPPST
jgi:Fibronectin type III domain